MQKTIKVIVLFLIILILTGFLKYQLTDYLTISYLKSNQIFFLEFYKHHSFQTPSIFFLLYIAITAFSIPGAAVMTLAAGSLFGFTTGALLVSFASTIGATIAFLTSRYLLRNYIQAKFSNKITIFNDGIKKDGNSYLLTLRLVPIFPFFLINLLMGITPIKARNFFIISQIGMLPGTLIYINAGKELSKIESLSSIFSPSLIISLSLLGIFPIIAKRGLYYLKSRKSVKDLISKGHS